MLTNGCGAVDQRESFGSAFVYRVAQWQFVVGGAGIGRF